MEADTRIACGIAFCLASVPFDAPSHALGESPTRLSIDEAASWIVGRYDVVLDGVVLAVEPTKVASLNGGCAWGSDIIVRVFSTVCGVRHADTVHVFTPRVPDAFQDPMLLSGCAYSIGSRLRVHPGSRGLFLVGWPQKRGLYAGDMDFVL